MSIYAITVAYCRSSQLARMLLEFRLESYFAEKHVVVQGHYPIDTERNNKEIELIVDSINKDRLRKVEIWDPGSNLGSAQSQQWALERIAPTDEDYWVNLDPDSACRSDGWYKDMRSVLDADPKCQVISCMSPMVEGFLKERNQTLVEKTVDGIRIGIPTQPTPFNLSMFRCQFHRETGGVKQLGIWWGELEALVYHECNIRGEYHAYLLDHVENEDGKFFHPKSNADWKDKHMRTVGPDQFVGNYQEYLRYFHPNLADLKL